MDVLRTKTDDRSARQWTIERRVRFQLRCAVRHRPRLYLPISRLRRRQTITIAGRPTARTSVVGDQTDIVIEGLHGSGNTFAFVAFQLAQPRPVEVAHHLHAEAQVIGGVRRGIPVLLLIRHPEDLVVSYASSFGLPVGQALKDYVTFYGRLMPYQSEVVVGHFDHITLDYAEVIHRVNQRHGTGFTLFDPTPDNVDRCFATASDLYGRTVADLERIGAFPSERRKQQERRLRAAFYTRDLENLRARAFHIYESYEEAYVRSCPNLAVFPARAAQ